MHSCCQHKVESFSYSAIVDLLRAVWNSLQRLLCCCSCVKIGWFSITQFLCKTDTCVLNPKSNNFGQNARIDVLVIFNSSYCRLVGQVLFYFFSTALGFWTSLEICNIFKGATSCWQEQHKVESFSSNSSGIVDLLRAVLTWLSIAGACTTSSGIPCLYFAWHAAGLHTRYHALAHCGWQYRRASPWQGELFVFARGVDCVDCKSCSTSPVIGALDCSVSPADIRTLSNSNANSVFQWLGIQRNVMQGCSHHR